MNECRPAVNALAADHYPVVSDIELPGSAVGGGRK